MSTGEWAENEGDLPDTEVIQLRDFLDKAIGEEKAFRNNVELAKAAGLGESTVRKVRGGGSINNRTFNKLAQAFGYLPSQFKAQLERLDADTELKRSIADEIRTAAAGLPDEDLQEILDLIRIKRERRKLRD